jgi:hypothetical protein
MNLYVVGDLLASSISPKNIRDLVGNAYRVEKTFWEKPKKK